MSLENSMEDPIDRILDFIPKGKDKNNIMVSCAHLYYDYKRHYSYKGLPQGFYGFTSFAKHIVKMKILGNNIPKDLHKLDNLKSIIMEGMCIDFEINLPKNLHEIEFVKCSFKNLECRFYGSYKYEKIYVSFTNCYFWNFGMISYISLNRRRIRTCIKIKHCEFRSMKGHLEDDESVLVEDINRLFLVK